MRCKLAAISFSRCPRCIARSWADRIRRCSASSGIEPLLERVGALRPLLIDDAHDESRVAGLGFAGGAWPWWTWCRQLGEVAPAIFPLYAIPVRLLRRDIGQRLLGAPGKVSAASMPHAAVVRPTPETERQWPRSRSAACQPPVASRRRSDASCTLREFLVELRVLLLGGAALRRQPPTVPAASPSARSCLLCACWVASISLSSSLTCLPIVACSVSTVSVAARSSGSSFSR